MSGDESMFDELLGVYALDATSDDAERRAIEDYLRISPRAAAEVAAHREVAAALAWSSMAPPDGLWDRLAAALEDTPPAPSGELGRVIPMAARPRRRWVSSAAMWAVAAAAAALVVVLGIAVLRDPRPTASLAAAMSAARGGADSRPTTLHAAQGAVNAEAVIDHDGHGYLDGRTLPGLASDRSYQLWGVIDGETISLGVLGHQPGIETFTVDGNITQLMISNEPAGGVPSPTNLSGLLVGNLT